MQLPRIEIDLAQIQDNARSLSIRYAKRGIALMGVSKVTLGDPSIATAMVQGGVQIHCRFAAGKYSEDADGRGRDAVCAATIGVESGGGDRGIC